MWHYERAETDIIKRSIQAFDWEGAFKGLNVDDKVELLNETILNIFENFIPLENITCRNRDPPWMSNEIKHAIIYKNRLFKKYTSCGNNRDDDIRL